MYILDSKKTTLFDASYFKRFCVSEKPDAALIVGWIDSEHPPFILGKYADVSEANDALYDLTVALAGDVAVFEMPDSRLFHAESIKHDARAKRKGGS